MDHKKLWVWQDQKLRPRYSEMFMAIAEIAASRSTCDRGPKTLFRDHRGTGSVIVSGDHRSLSIGYNGSVAGLLHCDDIGHLMVGDSCRRTLHSEENAILNATFSLKGSTIYTTTKPCFDCAKRIIQAGIVAVVYLHYYKSARGPDSEDLFKQAGVNCICIEDYLLRKYHTCETKRLYEEEETA